MKRAVPLGKSSENTKNAQLTEMLNKRGLEAYFERIMHLTGIEKPDIQIVQNEYSFIEAKQKPATVVDAISKAFMYRSSLISKGITPKVVFGVLYSQEEDQQCEVIALFNYKPFSIRDKVNNLHELADWIQSFISNPPEERPQNVDQVISILKESVSIITSQLHKVTLTNLKPVFGGELVFENILQFEPKDIPTNQMRKATAFLLINQILFYHLLSKEDPEEYPPLEVENIVKPTSLNMYFDKVLEKDYTVIFGFDVASIVPDEAVGHIKSTIGIVKALTLGDLGHDFIGRIFHDLIPLELRKIVAAFYTNNMAAELLATLAVKKATDKVSDFACGSGTLLVASYHRKKELLNEEREFSERDHVRFLEEEITGVDIMPFAAHLAAINLALQEPLYQTEKVRIGVWDSTDLKPNMTIPAMSTELMEVYKRPSLEMFGDITKSPAKYIKKGGIALDKRVKNNIHQTKVDLVIMNPPFTRQERLPEAYKNILTERFRDHSKYIRGQMGLHGFFILLADRFIEEGGRIALVIPATVMRLKSFEGIKDMLLEKYWIRYVIVSGHRSAFSESTNLRELILVVEKGEVQGNTIIARLEEIPKTREEALEFANQISEMKDNDTIRVQTAMQAEVFNHINRYLGEDANRSEELFNNLIAGSDKVVTLKELCRAHNLKILRGLELSGNGKIDTMKLLVLSDLKRALKENDEWYVVDRTSSRITAKNRISKKSIEVVIPLRYLMQSLRRPSRIGTMNISNDLDWIIKARFPAIDSFIPVSDVNEFVRWEKKLISKQTNFVFTRRFNITATGTKSLAYCADSGFVPLKLFWLIKGLSYDEAKVLTLFWNSSVNILQLLFQKTETEGGFIEIQGYRLNELMVIDPSRLLEEDRKEVIKIFDELSKEQLPSIVERYEQKSGIQLKIDLAISKAIGLNADENRLRETYTYITEELRRLKGVMN